MSITFQPREFKGSRFRCLLSTHRSRQLVADFLTSLSDGDALVTEEDNWAPSGFLEPTEVRLGETPGFLDENQRATVTKWWLANSGRANTPNWDLVSTAHVGGQPGLLLVEAKAHESEFADDRCGAKDPENLQRIQTAIAEANNAWDRLVPGFALSAEHHYQLSNRFAFAWKLAEMKIPIVLVYLGFLNADEMHGTRILTCHDAWKTRVVTGAGDTVPAAVWDGRFEFGGTSVTTKIKSANVVIEAALA